MLPIIPSIPVIRHFEFTKSISLEKSRFFSYFFQERKSIKMKGPTLFCSFTGREAESVSTNRMERIFRFVLTCLFVLGCISSRAGAQGPTAPLPPERGLTSDPVVSGRSESSVGDPSPQIQQTPLDAVLLINEAGKRSVALPGNWPLDVLDQFYEFLLKDQKAPAVPFTIQGISARGRVVEGRVEAIVRFTVTTTGFQAVRVPLGLREGILPFEPETPEKRGEQGKTLPYRYAGPGSFDLIVDPQDGQYIALIRPKKPEGEIAKETEVLQLPVSQLPATSPLSTGEKTVDSTNPAVEETPFLPIEEELAMESSLSPENETPLRADTEKPSTEPPTKPEASRLESDREGNLPRLPNEQRHELTFSLWFPLSQINEEEQRLSVSFPLSVGSQFILTVPMTGATASVNQGSLLDVVENPELKTTQFNVLGLRPTFEISWRKRKAEPTEDRPVLYVEEASIVARLENRSTVYEATLPVRSPSGSFDRLRIRLPQGAVLDHESTERYSGSGGYSFRLLSAEERRSWDPPSNEENEGVTRPESPPILEIQFARKTQGPVKIRLRATQQNPSEKPGSFRNLAGFDVIGAERQSGYLSVGIPGEMRPNWNPVRGIRRVELPGTLAQEGIDARFEFYAQPFLLRSQIVRPQTRINVKPEYQVRVNKGSLSMTAHFSFSIHGAKTEKLAIRLYDWQWIGDIKQNSIVDVDGIDQDETGLLTIPLRVPSEGSFEIELRAHRPIPPLEDGKRRMVVRLPRPEADWVNSAAFVVVPADNVEVVPIGVESGTTASVVESDSPPPVPIDSESNPAETVGTGGLTRRGRRSLPLRLEIPVRQQDPLVYESESTDAVFVGDIRYHTQEVKTSIQANVRLLEPENQVTEIISYDVAYEPVDRLSLALPRNWDDNTPIRVSLGGKTLELRDPASPAEDGTPDREKRKYVSLPEAMIGRFQLFLEYGFPSIQVAADMTTTPAISFVRPLDTVVSGHQVNMIVQQGVQIEPVDPSRTWKAVESALRDQGTFRSVSSMGLQSYGFQSSQDQERISLRVRLADRDVLGTTVVQRAWLQTWLKDSVRVDRGIYQITSDRDSITLRLPSAVVKEKKLTVQSNHVPVPYRLSPKGELTIPLTDRQKHQMFPLEIWYQISEDSRRSMRLELPHFGDDTLIRCEYWQLILPQNRHVIGVPAGWTPEYHWGWTNGLFWGRVPSVRMEEIGFQSGVSEETTISPQANQYLFSTLQPVSHTSFQVFERSVIVLFCSSLALLIGLILIYFPRTRYAGSLLGLGIALAAMAVYQPAPVLLMLQASSFGVLLALAAAYIYRIVHRDERWIVPSAPAWNEESGPSEIYSVIMDEESNREKGRAKSSSTSLD